MKGFVVKMNTTHAHARARTHSYTHAKMALYILENTSLQGTELLRIQCCP